MKKKQYLIFIMIMLVSITGCTSIPSAIVDTVISLDAEEDDTIDRPEDWAEETHSNAVEPNYEVVFPQDNVNRIDIALSEENWDTMLADMTELMGEFGEGGGGMAQERGGEEPQPRQVPQDGERLGDQPGNNRGPGSVAPDGGDFGKGATDENPVWVTATITFEGGVWEHVGIRFKGNSSLRSAWSAGNLKIPFKLDFDQFEDDYSEIDDQRFYGFKQLSLSSNFSDDSYLREKVTADIFRNFGVPSAHTAFYEVYVDYGEGPVYFGLYTMVEMIEDTVIEEQFTSDDGNLYKPEGAGATFAEGSFNEQSFDKETNQAEDDYSDIQAVFDALHGEFRLSDPGSWRTALEEVFDVDIFLRWLAVNTVVQNWDTYGVMSHNYYLYTDPDMGRVTWIPWDNNMALSDSEKGLRGTLSLGLEEVTDQWPLIRFLMDDPVYYPQYEAYLSEVIELVFSPEEMANTFQHYHDLIAASVQAETEEATMLRSIAAFEMSVQALIDHVKARNKAVEVYLLD